MKSDHCYKVHAGLYKINSEALSNDSTRSQMKLSIIEKYSSINIYSEPRPPQCPLFFHRIFFSLRIFFLARARSLKRDQSRPWTTYNQN